MTDRELLEDVKSKLDALGARVDTLEAAASGAVSHDEVQAVVDKEAALTDRVTALESVFGSTTTNPVSTALVEPLTLVAEPSDNHVIS